MNLLDRISRAVDSAIEAVIGAVVDRSFAQWAEEMAQAAKEEGQLADSLEQMRNGETVVVRPNPDGAP